MKLHRHYRIFSRPLVFLVAFLFMNFTTDKFNVVAPGLSGNLEEGGFSLSRKIRICQVFYRQDPRGQTQSIFVAATLKGYEK